MTGLTRPLAAAAVLALAAATMAVPPGAGAQATAAPAQADPSATTVPADGATTTTVAPDAPPATNPDGSPVDPNTTTTTVVDPFGASSEGLSTGVYGGQAPFDLGSMAVLGGELKRARGVLAAAQKRYDTAQEAIDATMAEFERLGAAIEIVGVEREDKVADASAAKASLRRRMVAAYVRGDDAVRLIGAMDDPVDYSRGRRYLEALAGLDRDAFDVYQQRIAEMNDSERRLVDDQAALQAEVDALVAERATALDELLAARRCADAYAQRSHVCPPGFVFPVLGEVTFAGTWGAPRMPGSLDQHWHEGTDIMAPEGREIVAVENGTLFKVGGDAGLGGLRLWLHGDSGTDYYYAHFSGFAPVAVDGGVVTAGTVIGYVGSTGNAAGGAPHLHFEVHPNAGPPVDPYPLLKVTWGTRSMPTQSAIMERMASVTGTLPPEER